MRERFIIEKAQQDPAEKTGGGFKDYEAPAGFEHAMELAQGDSRKCEVVKHVEENDGREGVFGGKRAKIFSDRSSQGFGKRSLVIASGRTDLSFSIPEPHSTTGPTGPSARQAAISPWQQAYSARRAGLRSRWRRFSWISLLCWLTSSGGRSEDKRGGGGVEQLDEFQLPHRYAEHAKQEQAVAPALNVGATIGALTVADRDVTNLKV